ncbi:hypothetical protein Tco_0067096 [Tanacetum coccineum]
MFMHTARDDSLLGTIRFISRHADTQIYGVILPQAMTNQALLDSVAYKTYYAIASGAEPSKLRKGQKKSESAISSEDTPSKKKSVKAKKYAATKPKPSKKKLKEATIRSKKSFMPHMQVAQVIELILDQGFLMSNNARSPGDSDEEDDDDETNSDDEGDDNDGDGDSDGDNDGNDDNDDDDDDDKNDDDKFVPTYDEEKMDEDEDEDDEVTKELCKDVNVNLGNEDAKMTNADQGGEEQHNTTGPMQSSSVSSDFTSKLMNLDNTHPCVDEKSSQTSSLFTVPVIVIHEIMSATTILPQAVLDFSTPVIEKTITELLEAVVLAKSSSQPKSTNEAPASLLEFELTKILMDKMEETKSYQVVDYKKELYDALVKSYSTDKDLFFSYGDVF